MILEKSTTKDRHSSFLEENEIYRDFFEKQRVLFEPTDIMFCRTSHVI